MLVALGVASLLAAIFCCASSAVALITRSQIALISLSQLIVLPATFLSTAMMPADLMPEWVQSVARWNPMTWAVELGRGGLSGTYPEYGWWQAAGLTRPRRAGVRLGGAVHPGVSAFRVTVWIVAVGGARGVH